MSNLDPENRNDPLNDVFPKVKVSSHTKCYPEENSFCVWSTLYCHQVAKCSFNKFGPSGTVETYDGLCILSLNIFNEKVLSSIWAWELFSILHDHHHDDGLNIDTDLHPHLVLVCLLDHRLRPEPCLEGKWHKIAGFDKLASLKATLVRNCDRVTDLLTGVKCRATSVAKNQLLRYLYL